MSTERTVRVGIIGTGFGARVVAPVFDELEGCELVEVVTPRDAQAVAALCASDAVDLISVHSPPFLHLDHVSQAIAGGHAVACDKPFGTSAHEAQQMAALAAEAGVVNIVNFEFRFDAKHQLLRSLLEEGAIGDPIHFQSCMFTALSRTPLRPYGWLFDAERGGGWIGAFGSHVIDFALWTFGEAEEAFAERRTTITERPDADGVLHQCTAEDGFIATLRSTQGVTTLIDSSVVAPVNLPQRMLVLGTKGTIETEGDHLLVLQTDDGIRQELDPNPHGGDVYKLPMQRWAEAAREAVVRGEVRGELATFADGLDCARVMDQLRS
jgi:predicted dehydrogenase